MKLQSRKLKIVMLLFILGFIGWGYKVWSRYREVHNFFKKLEDLVWANTYLDKKINFCDAPWENTIVLKSQEEDTYISPSSRYRVKPYRNDSNEDAFVVIDNKDGRELINERALFTYVDFKWAKDDRFLIFMTPITKDDWWASEIFISDTVTGQTIYFGDAEFYECGLKTW